MPGYYDVFSKRNEPHPDVFQYDVVPEKLRVQLVHILKDEVLNGRNAMADYVAKVVCEEHGILALEGTGFFGGRTSTVNQIVNAILSTESVGLILDFVEASLREVQIITKRDGAKRREVAEIIQKVNHRFRENGVGFEYNSDAQRLIPFDSTLLHESAIVPVLSLLAEERFSTPNAEFIAAWDEYKAGHFSDCVVKSCAAYESVLKIICTEKKWPFDPDRDACGTLVQSVVQGGGLDPFLTQPLTLIGTIRNKKSVAHGGGMVVRDVNQALAKYCLNATAASILYVVEATA